MSKKLGIRQARKAAFEIAAAMVNDADFDQLFPDLLNEYSDDPNIEKTLSDAQAWAVKYIRKMGGESHDQRK